MNNLDITRHKRSKLFKGFLFFGLIWLVTICMLPIFSKSYVAILWINDSVFNYNPLAIVLLPSCMFFGVISYDFIMQLIGKVKTEEQIERHVKKVTLFLKISGYAILVSLFIGIIVSPPIMYAHMAYKGYERCTNSQSPLDRAQFKRWVKAPADCSYWELNNKERKAVLERYEREGVWIMPDTND